MAFIQYSSPCFTTTSFPTLSVPIRASSRLSLPTTFRKWVPAFKVKSLNWVFSGLSSLCLPNEKRLIQEISDIEKNTGFKLRVLAQNYPDTPGLAIKDFWQVDDRTIVFVADPTFGNILNFNIGDSVDLDIPRSFWSRLAGKYGNMFYWKEKGEDASIEAAVMAISDCLREPVGPNNCSEVK
ncbi:hypothetical protein ES319_D09G161000v1 [Gossypium barbadense]|uniref:TPM domain-containing protein n=1 Tax=Gossypium barbadense TaxID=3634 RepID=A0A5J5Q3N7_GOSBA|nr:hypothetical protein ES319_D09G161000v1 [Gossypium barbadense]